MQQPFYSLDARWAAGIGFRNETRVDSVYDNGSIVDRFSTHERVSTAYAGWSPGLRDGWVTRWTAGVTSDERHATALPDPTASPVLPADRDLVYPWVGIEVVEDEYREARNQDQIARTEDLELGWHAKRASASRRQPSARIAARWCSMGCYPAASSRMTARPCC